MVRPYPLGYVAASTDGFNNGKADCLLGGVKDPGVWLSEKAMPPLIELHVRLTPLWVDNPTATAQLGECASCSLYPPRNAFSHVLVEAVGTGQYQKASGEEKLPFIGVCFSGYQLVLPEPFLYQKTFLAQPAGHQINIENQETLFQRTSLWAYGAQQVGDDIHPFVFTVDSFNKETLLRPSSLLFWREQGIHPLQEQEEGEVVFLDPFEEDHARTLFESIEAGMSVIQLRIGIDEKGAPLMVAYESCRLTKNTLIYKRKGSI